MKKIVVLLSLTLMSSVFSGCWIQDKLQNDVEEVNKTINETVKEISVKNLDDTALAFSLLTVEEVKTIDDISNARPSLLEFNDHLDNNRDDSYISFVARQWFNPDTGDVRIGNAISTYADKDLAQAGLEKLAGDNERIEKFTPIGDKSLLLYEKANEELLLLPALTYRFTVDNYAVRVTVHTLLENPTVEEIQEELLPTLELLAKAQYNRLLNVINGSITGPETNPAMEKLPKTVSGTDFLGTAVVSALEWRGLEANFKETDISGFKSGAISYFKIQSRPDELLEVTIMEFDGEESAKSFQEQLIPVTPIDGVSPLELSEELDETSDALSYEWGVELQSYQGNYMIDVSILAPFGEITDKDATIADLEKMTKEIIAGL